MNRIRWMLATATFACLTLTSLAYGEKCIDWAKNFARYESALAQDSSRESRFEDLDRAALTAVMAGELEKARAWAEESLEMAPSHRSSWNYGNAIHHSHLVLGHLALRRGDVNGAEKELLAAATQTPGSQTLREFGPNMSLAAALFEKGRRTAVLAYIEECRRFWARGKGTLDDWKATVERGEVPDFRSSLLF